MPPNDKPEAQKKKRNLGGVRPGAGRPAFVPTNEERRQAEAMSGFGVPMEQIAAIMRGGIHLETLRAHFAEELLQGKAKANAKIGQTLFQKALGGDTAAMIWWSKTQMRWSETQKIEVNGAGNPHLAALVGLASATAARVIEHEPDAPADGITLQLIGESTSIIDDMSEETS
jgi:hypothetical protein